MRRLLPALLLAVAVLAGAVGVGPAGGESAESARTRREQARRERSAAASRLDALRASDAELADAVAALDAEVAAQERAVAGARQAVAAAEEQVAQAQAQAAGAAQRVDQLRAETVRLAVDLYVQPRDSTLTQLIDDDGLEAGVRRDQFLRQVNGRREDVVDQLRAAEEDWGRAEVVAAQAAASARGHADALEQRLGEVRDAREAKRRVQADLDRRIAEVQAEVASLAATEASLSAVIRQREAEEAAEERQRSSAANSGGAAAPSGGAVSGGGLSWPLRGAVTSEYGQRWGRLHAGVDIDGNTGDAIAAAGAGTVIFAGVQGGYGNVVILGHGGGVSTVYAHQSRIAVGVGASVSRGQVIGYVGNTGRSTGPHLHFEVRVGGTPQNPRRYLP